jgi:hypothetical protein
MYSRQLNFLPEAVFFCDVRPYYEQVVSNLYRPMHISMGIGRSQLVHRRVAHN